MLTGGSAVHSKLGRRWLVCLFTSARLYAKRFPESHTIRSNIRPSGIRCPECSNAIPSRAPGPVLLPLRGDSPGAESAIGAEHLLLGLMHEPTGVLSRTRPAASGEHPQRHRRPVSFPRKDSRRPSSAPFHGRVQASLKLRRRSGPASPFRTSEPEAPASGLTARGEIDGGQCSQSTDFVWMLSDSRSCRCLANSEAHRPRTAFRRPNEIDRIKNLVQLLGRTPPE